MRFLQSSFWLAALLGAIGSARAAGGAVLELESSIPMPSVRGRIDHFAVDTKRNRLFVAALGNDTVEVIDLKRNRHERSLAGFGEPQGILYVPDQDRIYVANGKADRVDVLDADSLAVRKRLDSEDADNLRMDRKGGKVIVGYGKGALRFIDPASEEISGEVRLSGHPESFQMEEAGSRIFVNVPTANHVAVVDRVKRALVGKWDTAGAGANFPMALDEAGRRLFVGARRPAVLLVYDTTTGRVVAKLPIGEDTDDIFFDSARKRVYVICGGGRVDIFSQDAPDKYSLSASVQTAPRARTGFFDRRTGKLYVAAPAMGGSPARILVYGVAP
jgi:DNA-binding beta-propeller fold protein YncE